MPNQLERIPVELIDRNPDNSRTHFNEAGESDLGISLRQGQRVPCIVYRSGNRYTLVDGERRWRAARRVGLPELLCVVLEKAPTKGELLLTQIAIDAHNAHLSPMERALLYAGAMRENNLTAVQLHEREGISQATITRYLSVFKCGLPAQEALGAGSIGISDCYEISKLPEAEQAELLASKLSGASRDDIARLGRRKRNGDKPAAKVSRVKVLLPGSGQIVVSRAGGLSLDEFIECLGEAQKEAKNARKLGQDAKVFSAMMANKVKKLEEKGDSDAAI